MSRQGVVNSFRKYNFDPSMIMEAFTEVIDIKDAWEEIKRKQKKVEDQQEILDRKLEETGFGDLEKLTQTVAALTTLSQYGLRQDN
jgi:oligoribonuclease NrnB/cAMP/cGMP phosphodiesterase (DHH superfamily)